MKSNFVYYWLGERLSKFFSRSVAYVLAAGVAWVYANPLSSDFQAVQRNLKEVSAQGASGNALKRQSKELIQNFSRYLVDLFYTHELSLEFIRKRVEIRGIEYLKEALDKKKGAILASAHLGNWEMGGMVISKLGYAVHAVALKHQDPRINRIFQMRREAKGLRITILGDFVKGLYEALKKNELVALNADRNYGDGGIRVHFMNRATNFPSGMARLSRATGAAVLPVFFVMNGYNKYLLDIQQPLASEGREAMVRAFAKRLQAMIRQYPTQWFLFQNFWETPKWPA